MRTRKAFINSITNILSFIVIFIPNLIVRKVFLNSLGQDILGLSSLYTNIIGWLSIIEMGIGPAIIYSLYKPYANNERDKIKSYLKFYGWIYVRLGIIIFILGIVISPFIIYFIKGDIDGNLVTISFILYLINTFITYLFSHKICILNVAQESYKITISTTITKLIIMIVQIIILKNYPSFKLFITVQIILNLLYYVWINIYILNRYPWINGKSDELDYNERKDLFKNIRAMFMHKIGGLVVNSTDNIVISTFIGLKSLSIYTNYQTIISALQSIVSNGLSGLTASIGNLLADDHNRDKAYEVHRKIFFLNFWIVSFITITLYNTLNQFIVIWMGKDNLLDNLTVIIILINIFLSMMKSSVEQFQAGKGIYYQDRYAPICESVINLVLSLILVNHMGIKGVFLGTLVSNLTVVFWTKPYIVYKYIFNKNLSTYFKMYFRHVLLSIVPLSISIAFTHYIKYKYTIISFIYNCLINIIVINLIYIIIFYRTEEFKYFKDILKRTFCFNRQKRGTNEGIA